MWIDISQKLTSSQLIETFKTVFPEKEILIRERFNDGSYEEGTYDCICEFEKNNGEFPLIMNFYWIPPKNDTDNYWECIKIAKILASRYDCMTICDGSIHGGGSSYDILFRDGKSYLVYDEDEMTVCGFDNGRGIMIKKEIIL